MKEATRTDEMCGMVRVVDRENGAYLPINVYAPGLQECSFPSLEKCKEIFSMWIRLSNYRSELILECIEDLKWEKAREAREANKA